MWIADGWKDYEVLDTSRGEKLERTQAGGAKTGITTEAKREAANGNSSASRSSGPFTIRS